MKPEQRKVIDRWFDTSRYVYNKALDQIVNHKHPINFIQLRDRLVTLNTKKNDPQYSQITADIARMRTSKRGLEKYKVQNQEEIARLEADITTQKQNLRSVWKTLGYSTNDTILPWELDTPKDVRAAAVDDVCKAHKTGFANLKRGNIKFFNMKFKRKTEPSKCLSVPSTMIENKRGIIEIAPEYLKSHKRFPMGKRTAKKHRDLVIKNDCRLVKQRNEYWLMIPIPFASKEPRKRVPENYCGIDPGIRTFMTAFGNDGCSEYSHDYSALKRLDSQIRALKSKPNRVRKRKITKRETRKDNLLDEIHWKTIRSLLTRYDILFYGDIKSHDVVKNKKNHTLNRDTNNLKFFKFKERLLFKATERQKQVIAVKEHFTTQTCSSCGSINRPGISKIYHCAKCDKQVGRDVNAAKNILMKGIVQNA